MKDENKFRASSKYFTISTYVILSVIIISIVVKAIFFWDDTSNFFNKLISTLSPFLYGILIAILINPLVNWCRLTLFKKLIPIKNKGLNKILSILLSYVVILSAIILIIIYIVPELINSLSLLLDQIPIWVNSLVAWVESLPFTQGNNSSYFEALEKGISSIDSTMQKTISDLITSLTTTVVLTGVSIIKFAFNLIVAIIVSCYLLIDKDMQTRSLKRIIYAFFKKETSDNIWNLFKTSTNIFSEFFTGKMIDSLIIGLLCFISMMIISFFNVPGFGENVLLVSIIVCVTNMIPYFGPFLGGIPCTLLLLIYSPNSALIFGILILVIQQLDGNVIGPKILGDSTGLRPLWIIFAITVGGWIGGAVGMLLGVPCVAVISGLIEAKVDKKLSEKDIDMPIVTNEKIIKEKKKK